MNCVAIDSQFCFHRRLFADPLKPSWCITGPVGPLGSTNQNWLGAKLLPMAVLIYPVVCVHPCRLLRAQYHCLWSNGREGLPSACSPAPTTPCPLVSAIHDITGVVKNYLKNLQWILHSKSSYKTVAISLLYLYSKCCVANNVAQENHVQLLQCFKTVFLKIQNVTLWSVFSNSVTFLKFAID